MRIGIDGRYRQGGTGTGIATYAQTLLRALQEMGAETEMLVAGAASARGRPRRYATAVATRLGGLRSSLTVSDISDVGRLRMAPDAFRCAQVHFDIWRRLLPVTGEDLPDVMHWTAPLPLRLAGVPNIYTLHDVIPLRRPNRTDTDPVRYLRLLRAIAGRADHVVTVSEASRDEILDVLPELAGRLSVIPEAVDLPARVLAMTSAELDSVARAQVGCGVGEFYLFCGTIEPRKNVPALIRAFRASGSGRRLVIAGPDGFRAAEEVTPLIGGRVIRVGYLERDTLLALMRGARGLLYPSLGEGFGLPIIEAMGLGTAVLTTRGGATEEVAAGAALLVDAGNLADLTDAIRLLDSDTDLGAVHSQASRARGSATSTAVYAARLASLYTNLSGGAGAGALSR